MHSQKNALWIRMTLGIKFDLLLTDYLLFIYLLLSSNYIKVRQDLENGEFWFAHLILYFYVVCCENKCSFRKCHLFSYKPTVNSKKCTYTTPFPQWILRHLLRFGMSLDSNISECVFYDILLCIKPDILRTVKDNSAQFLWSVSLHSFSCIDWKHFAMKCNKRKL